VRITKGGFICEFQLAGHKPVIYEVATLQTYDFILSANGKVVTEDVNPSSHKMAPVVNGYILHNVTGIRTHIVRRLDGKGYEITKRKCFALVQAEFPA
jgi:hypothetical protein